MNSWYLPVSPEPTKAGLVVHLLAVEGAQGNQ